MEKNNRIWSTFIKAKTKFNGKSKNLWLWYNASLFKNIFEFDSIPFRNWFPEPASRTQQLNVVGKVGKSKESDNNNKNVFFWENFCSCILRAKCFFYSTTRTLWNNDSQKKNCAVPFSIGSIDFTSVLVLRGSGGWVEKTFCSQDAGAKVLSKKNIFIIIITLFTFSNFTNYI